MRVQRQHGLAERRRVLASTGYQLNSCTVMGNSATNQYGGTYSGTIKNSIISCNEAPSSPNWNSGAITYSCTDPLPSGAGNTNVNPLVSGYCAPHLLPDSPLLGCGLTNLDDRRLQTWTAKRAWRTARPTWARTSFTGKRLRGRSPFLL